MYFNFILQYMSDNIIDLALKYLSETKESSYKIAKETGISESGVGKYKRGVSRPTIANARILVQYFEGNLPTINNVRVLENFDFMLVPIVHISAAAGYPKGAGNQEYIEQLPTIPVIVDKNYKGKYRVFEVDGDSMDDGTRKAICDKDKILCREIPFDMWKSKLHINDWYFVIVLQSGDITVKQIKEHDVERGIIYCHPLNPLFNDFEIDLRDVVELYNLIKVVDRNYRL